jgi:hypothetical protein
MMAVAGILGQELLGVQPAWWEAGAKDYDVPMTPLLAMEFLVSGDNQPSCCFRCVAVLLGRMSAETSWSVRVAVGMEHIECILCLQQSLALTL